MATVVLYDARRQGRAWLRDRLGLHARQVATGLALALASTCGISLAMAQTSPVQTCQFGDLKLESGASIPNVRMTYITHGTPNAERSNAILSIHGLRGNREAQSFLAGPGKALDTDRYFVVQPDTLGVAWTEPNATTSPTRSGMNMSFPRFTLRDMVNAEYRLVTECLHVSHLVAVTGISMGGNASMQWAVSYPDFMDAVIWSDVPNVGITFQVLTNGKPDLARRVADDMAATAWRQRKALLDTTTI